jgi:hypothetical protein
MVMRLIHEGRAQLIEMFPFPGITWPRVGIAEKRSPDILLSVLG